VNRLIAQSRDLVDRIARLLNEANRRTLYRRPAGPDLYRLAHRIGERRSEPARATSPR
jgi:hypothetical protein